MIIPFSLGHPLGGLLCDECSSIVTVSAVVVALTQGNVPTIPTPYPQSYPYSVVLNEEVQNDSYRVLYAQHYAKRGKMKTREGSTSRLLSRLACLFKLGLRALF